MSHTVDDDTYASAPGEITIQKSKYLTYAGITGLARLKYLLLLNLPHDYLMKRFGQNKVVYGYIQKTEQFKGGCLNPTVVINKQKGLIATFTNLTSWGGGVTPAIKISREPLQLIKNARIENGDRLPTVAVYARNMQDEHAQAWADFLPNIANCFTDDAEACNALLARVTQSGWACLEQGLAQIPNPEKPGLYYVTLDEQLVREA